MVQIFARFQEGALKNIWEMDGGIVKICVLGGPSVGKTALLYAHCMRSFPKEYRASSSPDFFLLTRPGFQVHLWDIPSCEDRTGRTPMLFSDCKGFFVVADVSSKSSLDDANMWFKDARKRFPDAPIVLLFNKSDLRDGYVRPAVMADFAKSIGFAGWFETSALENARGFSGAIEFLLSKLK